MKAELISGVPASKVFREILNNDLRLDAYHSLGDKFMSEFPGISPATTIAIKRWLEYENKTENHYECDDDSIDALILHYLESAGYIGGQ